MTIEEIMASTKPMLTPADIAPVIGMHQQAINILAREGTLPFNYIRSGNRTKIPRPAFIRWYEGKEGK